MDNGQCERQGEREQFTLTGEDGIHVIGVQAGVSSEVRKPPNSIKRLPLTPGNGRLSWRSAGWGFRGFGFVGLFDFQGEARLR